jgi:alpha-L-rhamnosidase
MSAPTRLRVEHLDDAFGICVARPRLSWQLPPGTQRQRAYRIQAGDWDAGRVESDQSILVPYDGPALESGQAVAWRVKVWTDHGESDWSEPGAWEMGLLDVADWTARWIEPTEDDHLEPGTRPAYLLRHEFALELPRTCDRARLYATAHGIYELLLNGERVGDAELMPGFTSYRSNLHVQVFDVAGLLVDGDNVVSAVLSDGWYRGKTGFIQLANAFGDRVAFLAQLHVDTDAVRQVVTTGKDWQWSTGPITSADLMDGQAVDLRVVPGAWWPVSVVDHDFTRLTSSPAPPVRRVEELTPVAITRPALDRQVVDFGQNSNGWVRLTRLGPSGTSITLTHGEALDASGDVTTEHLNAFDFETRQPLPVGQIDHVTSAGGDAVFEPRHTTHGFRYVRVEGHPERLEPVDVTSVVVHTDLRRTGWFRCSDHRINRLHDVAVWSFRTNACDVPTDCPQRERAGWTGDWQLFVPTAAYLYDVAGFSTKWLRDLASDQRADGRVPNFVPEPAALVERGNALASAMCGSAGWGDAAVVVPWELWRAYGDERLLAEQWPSMVAWVDYATRAARSDRHESRVQTRPDPAPHEEFIWDTGFHWGEWLEPGSAGLADTWGKDKGDLATAFLHRSSLLVARIAEILGRTEDATQHRRLADNVLAAWRKEFIASDGSVTPDTQANHARALAFGLVPDALRAQTAEHLVELIRAAGTHLGTGFLATPYLLPVLADTGHLDVAYELLFQDTPPSWLTMIDRGATTVWEQWDGIDDDGVAHASLNHYSKGAVISFLHAYTAGIRLLDESAYRRFRIEPRPGGGITWANAEHDSPFGRIESSWRTDHGRFLLDVRVPPGTSAEVRLPDGARTELHAGTASFECATGAAGES